jgi:hypothetical protein
VWVSIGTPCRLGKAKSTPVPARLDGLRRGQAEKKGRMTERQTGRKKNRKKEGWGASETTLRLQHVRWRGLAFRKNSGREWTISVSLSVPLSVFLSNAVPQADSTRINDYA